MKLQKFSIAAGLLLTALLGQCLSAAWHAGQTTDETYYSATGYAMVRHHNYEFLGEHPPLIMQLASLPLLVLQPRFDIQNPIYLANSRAVDISKNGARFLYKMGNNPYLILFLQRLPIICLTVILGLILALLARELAGNGGAFFGLALYAFDPNMIAHGSLITSDMGLTAFYFFSIFAIKKFFDNPCVRGAVWAGIFCGLTFCAKVSGLVLFPVVLTLFTVFYFSVRQNRLPESDSPRFDFWAGCLAVYLLLNALGQKQAMVTLGPLCLLGIYLFFEKRVAQLPWRPAIIVFRVLLTAGSILALVFSYKLKKKYGLSVSAVFVLWNLAAYVFAYLFLKYGRSGARVASLKLFILIWLVTGLVIILDYTEVVTNFYRFIGFGRYVQPLGIVLSHSQGGHHVCLEGSFVTCDWRYFFAILGVKTPLMTLGLGLLGLILLLKSRLSWIEKAVVIVPPGLFFGAALFNGINIGLRHILPVYPFLLLSAAFAAARLWETGKQGPVKTVLRVFLVLALAGTAGRVLTFAPDYLTYMSEAIGTSERGARLVTDSNLNWGQGNKHLAEFVKTQNIPFIKISSEAANPDVYDYHGINWQEMSLEERIKPSPGHYALGIGVYAELQRRPESWFFGKKPLYSVGKTVYIFEVPGESSVTVSQG